MRIAKNYYLLALHVLVAILIFRELTVHLKNREELANARELMIHQESQITLLKDSGVRVKVVPSTNQNADLLLSEVKGLKDKYGKVSRINSLLQAQLAAKGKLKDTVYEKIIIIDSIPVKVRSFNISDGYLDIHCEDTNDVVSCPYTYTDSISVIYHVIKFKLFKPSTWKKDNRGTFVDVIMSKGKVKGVKVIYRD